MLDGPVRGGIGLDLLGSGGKITVRLGRHLHERELNHNRAGTEVALLNRPMPSGQRERARRVRHQYNRGADNPEEVLRSLRGLPHGGGSFSRPTSATLRKPAARSRSITAIRSPYATVLSARRKMRVSRSPLVAASSAAGRPPRSIGSSPSANVRSAFKVRNCGAGGRGCGSAVEVGRLTATSTVASGAATMKMIKSTSITSMNGVTLISWISSKPSSPWSSRTLIRLRPFGSLRRRTPLARLDFRGLVEIDVATGHPQHLGRGIGKQRPVCGDRTREHIVDHDRRNCGREPEGCREQR